MFKPNVGQRVRVVSCREDVSSAEPGDVMTVERSEPSGLVGGAWWFVKGMIAGDKGRSSLLGRQSACVHGAFEPVKDEPEESGWRFRCTEETYDSPRILREAAEAGINVLKITIERHGEGPRTCFLVRADSAEEKWARVCLNTDVLVGEVRLSGHAGAVVEGRHYRCVVFGKVPEALERIRKGREAREAKKRAEIIVTVESL